MPRSGGNRVRRAEEFKSAAVFNEPRTMLNLLKTVPGVFGSVPNHQVEGMDPAIVYVSGGKHQCYYDPKEVSLTRPFAHRTLAEAEGTDLESSIRAYLAYTAVGTILYPHAHDLTRNGIPGEPLEATIEALRERYAGKAAVELGGVLLDGKQADLVTVALNTQTFLAEAHDRGLGFMRAEQNMRNIVDASLA